MDYRINLNLSLNVIKIHGKQTPDFVNENKERVALRTTSNENICFYLIHKPNKEVQLKIMLRRLFL